MSLGTEHLGEHSGNVSDHVGLLFYIDTECNVM